MYKYMYIFFLKINGSLLQEKKNFQFTFTYMCNFITTFVIDRINEFSFTVLHMRKSKLNKEVNILSPGRLNVTSIFKSALKL